MTQQKYWICATGSMVFVYTLKYGVGNHSKTRAIWISLKRRGGIHMLVASWKQRNLTKVGFPCVGQSTSDDFFVVGLIMSLWRIAQQSCHASCMGASWSEQSRATSSSGCRFCVFCSYRALCISWFSSINWLISWWLLEEKSIESRRCFLFA